MRFPTIFRRRVGEPPEPISDRPDWLEPSKKHPGSSRLVPELGSDEVPGGGDDRPERNDNLHESRMVNVNGFPGQRVCVGYQGPDGAPALLAELYLYDETSRSWFRVPATDPAAESRTTGVLVPGALAYFDPPCLLDHSRAKRNSEDESHQAGSLEVLLVVQKRAPGDELGTDTYPLGVYTFVVGTDVSNPA